MNIDIDKLIEEFDTDNSGSIEYEEFKALLLATNMNENIKSS